MLTYPEIDPIIFAVGPVAIRWYGLMYVIGFLFAWWLARKRSAAAWSPVTAEQVDDLIFNGMLGVIIGGRVGYCLLYGFDQLISDPLYLFKITEGGMSFHGGLVGVMIAMWWFGRSRGKSMWTITDFIAPVTPLGLMFGRIGNFINGELWGSETTMPWGFNVNGVGLHASQLYEAFLEGLVLFVVLWFFSAKQRPPRALSGLFLLLYGVFRFAIEFVRTPDADIGYLAWGWVTMGQALSLPMVIAGAALLALAYNQKAEARA